MKRLLLICLLLTACAAPRANAAAVTPSALTDSCLGNADAATFYGQDLFGFFIRHDFATLGKAAWWRMKCSEDDAFTLTYQLYVADQAAVNVAPLDSVTARAQFSIGYHDPSNG